MNAKDSFTLRESIGKTFGKGARDSITFRTKVRGRLITPLRKYYSIEELLKSGDFDERIFGDHNTLTQLGDALIADAMSDRGDAQINYIAIGSGTPASKTTASTTLQTELARVICDSRTQGAGASDNDVVWVATFPAGTGTGAVTEAGLFNHATVGTMFAYTDFAVVNKSASDIIIFNWTLTCGLS